MKIHLNSETEKITTITADIDIEVETIINKVVKFIEDRYILIEANVHPEEILKILNMSYLKHFKVHKDGKHFCENMLLDIKKECLNQLEFVRGFISENINNPTLSYKKED